jgi:hypothetical protein
MHTAFWISKAKNTHSEYIILIAFPLQQWLHESAFMLLYTYIASFVSASLCSHVTNLLLDTNNGEIWKNMT